MQSIALCILLESVMQFAEENNNKTNAKMIGNINFEKLTNSIFVVYLF